jgi:hypothetical protein
MRPAALEALQLVAGYYAVRRGQLVAGPPGDRDVKSRPTRGVEDAAGGGPVGGVTGVP